MLFQYRHVLVGARKQRLGSEICVLLKVSEQCWREPRGVKCDEGIGDQGWL